MPRAQWPNFYNNNNNLNSNCLESSTESKVEILASRSFLAMSPAQASIRQAASMGMIIATRAIIVNSSGKLLA